MTLDQLMVILPASLAVSIILTRMKLARQRSTWEHLCPHCRHQLSPSPSKLCPECGVVIDPEEQFRLDVRRLWIVLTASLLWLGIVSIGARIGIWAFLNRILGVTSAPSRLGAHDVQLLQWSFIGAYMIAAILLFAGLGVIIRCCPRRFPGNVEPVI